jgi:hypothetical protein
VSDYLEHGDLSHVDSLVNSWEDGVLEFRPPSAFEEERRKEFQTYDNYVAALGYLATTAAADSVVSSERFQRIERRTDISLDRLGRLMRLAWVTEANLVAAVQLAGDSLAGHNAMHQTYYAPYTALRAYFLASGLEVPQSHQAHLRALGDTIRQRPELFATPWRMLASGDPGSARLEITGSPSAFRVADVSNLITFVPSESLSIDLLAKALKTTRKQQTDEAISNWKIQNRRKRILAPQREAVAARVPPTSVFHFLYRLRIRADYQDADAFISGMVTESEAETFCRNLAAVTYGSLGCLELLIAKYVGKAAFASLVESFLESDHQGLTVNTIQQRWLQTCKYL